MDQQLDLAHAGDAYRNWGDANEKWINSLTGHWYFITPAGKFYKWDGISMASTPSSHLLATLLASYYDDTSKLYDAHNSG